MKHLLAVLLSVLIFTATIPKADAGVGILLKSRTIKVMGGLTAATGSAGLGTGLIVANITGSWAAIGFAVLGLYAGVCGLIILDEKNTNMVFSFLDEEWGSKLQVTQQEIDIFNSEVEELNLIKEVIESKITDKSSPKVIDELWKTHKEFLSPETMKVASQVVLRVFANK